MSVADDDALMARALALAERGAASTDPNPSVGCVIVRDGEVVGEGFTQPAGGPHAEIEALAAAGERAAGASVYVSLEPCAHTGRTGPCVDALIAAGVARVVFAVEDPNPAVAGGGAHRLEAAGIRVESGRLAGRAEAVNRGFFRRMRTGRPWLRCKMAASLDGRTALANGQSQWITGAAARADVHRRRARSSAVMTGIGTVLADDPALNARPDEPGLRVLQPLRVILDSTMRTPPTARTFGLDGKVVLFAAASSDGAQAARRAALEAAGARIETVARESIGAAAAGAARAGAAVAGLDLAAVVGRLGALECNTVWLEAGPTLAGAMLAAGLVDELVLYLAPCLLGDSARGLFALPALASLEDRYRLTIDAIDPVGDDLRIIARPERD
jgi:diaminohydroxyphosphoribosylaminopyrimidine deaminase/5-amino-6-(5-phosphoribosylamino)uracil reductase